MSYIPNCREDDTYNEKYLQGGDADYVAGFDWAVQCGMNNFFENIDERGYCDREEYKEIEEAVTQITPDNILGVLAKRPDLMEKLQEELNNWVEMERDELITSMIESIDEDKFDEIKSTVDSTGEKNSILLQQEQIGIPFEE